MLCSLPTACGEVVSDPPPRQHWLIRLGTDEQDGAGAALIDGTDILLPMYSEEPQVGYIANAGVDGVGNVFATGRDGYDQEFVVKLSASGEQVWKKNLQSYVAWPIGVTAGGEVTFEVDLLSEGQQLLVRLDAQGEVRWQIDRPFEEVQEILVAPQDRVVLVSECHPKDNPIDPDLCLWAFASDGGELWHQRLHDPKLGLQYGGATRSADRILITAVSTYSAPPEELQFPQALLSFELDALTGELRSQQELASGDVSIARAPALLDGDLVVSGTFAGTVDFGIGTLTSKDIGDIFLAKLP